MCPAAAPAGRPPGSAGSGRPVIGFDGVRRRRYSQRRLRKYQSIPRAVVTMMPIAT